MWVESLIWDVEVGTLHLSIILILEEEVGVVEAKPQQFYDVLSCNKAVHIYKGKQSRP